MPVASLVTGKSARPTNASPLAGYQMTSSSTPTIREATAADVPAILGLIRELAEYERLLDLVVATEDSLHRSLFGPRPFAEALLAEDAGVPIGFALYFHNFSTFLGKPGVYLEDLFVQPAYRGRGLGKSLLTRVAQIAVERDCGRMEWSVLNWNEPSIRFYESLGAKPLSDWTLYRLTGDELRQLGTQ